MNGQVLLELIDWELDCRHKLDMSKAKKLKKIHSEMLSKQWEFYKG